MSKLSDAIAISCLGMIVAFYQSDRFCKYLSTRCHQRGADFTEVDGDWG
ncbi:hypothetical protein I8748_09805 [Nostoc sp. CENA67]|uniref:Uncharacterized protein n=1 Tax=Amazonocrinis nigriterrae CENA67 TaxID=2794033 RepID=A0A8J7L7T6_9NOST|nr:hypothetical protein [Amazonocrinis nigriterrae]MBH8562465.1 hypothetical protein [Amazonocrinis nigriterrae CENA67]